MYVLLLDSKSKKMPFSWSDLGGQCIDIYIYTLKKHQQIESSVNLNLGPSCRAVNNGRSTVRLMVFPKANTQAAAPRPTDRPSAQRTAAGSKASVGGHPAATGLPMRPEVFRGLHGGALLQKAWLRGRGCGGVRGGAWSRDAWNV